jgi:diguanylate cyclase
MFLGFFAPNNLTQKMLRVVFSIYLTVTLFITSAQFFVEYLKTRDAILVELHQLEETVQGPISISLWQFNQTQLNELVAGLVKMPIIVGVDISNVAGEHLVSQRAFTPNAAPLSIFETKSTLNRTLNGKDILLGTLTLYSSSEVVFDRVLFGFWLIALTAVIKISILFCLFIWAFNRYLALPLRELMVQVEEVQLTQNAGKRIKLSNTERNELSHLQTHMNAMLAAMEKDRQRLLEDEQTKRVWLEDAVAKRTEELQILNEKLENIARVDSLTGVLNRGSFFETAQHIFLLAQRQKSPASFVLMDLDHFKLINDTFGHFVGDKVLIHFTQTIQKLVRKSDLIGRVGGEEFALFLPDTGSEEAFQLAEKIRKAISESTLEVESKTVTYRVSIGIEIAQAQDQVIDALFKRADVKLYGAKDKGRDRVEQ